MKKSLQELLKCVCTEHLDASPVNPLVKGKIVLLNQLIKKYFSRFEITEGMHLDEVLSLSGLCMDCIVKLISSLSQHQHQLITEIVCMILDILFGLYCRCLGETELNLSIESNSLILIEGKLSASSSSTNSYLHTVYNSLKDTLEALFLIDWEPDIAINLLIHLVPMLSRVPGVVTDFKVCK
ncbi:hypothetical protein EON65_18950 [archaeon]|nr:MAG: hypothetical protein EON65_18950 [archaeon]